jgi:hypothetical protein
MSPSNVEDSSSLAIESDPGTDTRVRQIFGRAASMRLLSFRAQEAHAQALPCQDFAMFTCDRQGTSICFCVCDGVGSSFKGDFAAQYLAVSLVNWLQKLTNIPRRPAKLLKKLQPQMDEWAREAQSLLTCSELPQALPPLVREVLDELRATYGSETVFLCGRIDMEGESQPAEESYRGSAKALFYWMGNVTARLFLTENKYIDVGDKNNDAPRWSTVHGRKGVLRTRILALETLDRLLVHTDGLDVLEEELVVLDDSELQMRIENLRSLPRSDDMTLLDLQWRANASTAEKEEVI